jgi:hypothetical protein
LAQPLKSDALYSFIGYLLLLGIVGGALEGYDYLDQKGLIKHTVETNLTAQGNCSSARANRVPRTLLYNLWEK